MDLITPCTDIWMVNDQWVSKVRVKCEVKIVKVSAEIHDNLQKLVETQQMLAYNKLNINKRGAKFGLRNKTQRDPREKLQ